MWDRAQFADPAVSRGKFDREIAEFRSQAEEYGRRGWFLARADFPCALVILATAKTQPIAIVCGLWFDYTNYDAAPPSVRFVHPLTCVPYRHGELPTPLLRSLPGSEAPAMIQGNVQLHVQTQQPLMQAYGPEDIPFLCVAGVREYHEHPAHSGDHWELYRPSGGGRLIRLLEIVSKYGLEPIVGFHVQMIPQVGFRFGVAPE